MKTKVLYFIHSIGVEFTYNDGFGVNHDIVAHVRFDQDHRPRVDTIDGLTRETVTDEDGVTFDLYDIVEVIAVERAIDKLEARYK